MPECGYVWDAPYLYPPNENGVVRRGTVRQVCVEPRGHAGLHRSISKVVADNVVRPRGVVE